jgi:lambda family phage tail tape measure protein
MASSITDFLIRVKVQGKQLIDNLTKSSNNAEKSVNKTNTAIKSLGDSLSNAAGGGNQFTDMLSNGLGKMGPYGAALGAAAAAFAALGLKAIASADAIQDLSDVTGISSGRLINFKESILNAGGKTEDFEKVALKLTQTLGDAAEGNEKVRKSFRDLGINLGDANGKLRSTDELLPEIINSLAQIENPAERSAKAVELLGKSAARIDWTQVQAINDPFKDAQIAQLAKYQAAIDKIANSVENNLITVFGELAVAADKGAIPALQRMYEMLVKLRDLGGYNPMSWLADVIPGVRAIERVIGGGSFNATPLPKGVTPSTAEAGRGGQGGPTAAELAGEQQKKLTGQLAVTAEGQKQITIAKAQTAQIMQQNDLASAYATKVNETLGMQQQAGDIARSNLSIDFERDKKLADINRQIETELANKERDQRVTNAIVVQLREQAMQEISMAEQRKTAKQDEIGKLQYQRDLIADILLMNQQFTQDLQVKQLSGQNSLIGLYGDELKLKQGLMQIENERTSAILAANNRLAALGKNVTTADDTRANSEIAQARKVADEKVKILEDQISKEKALRNDASAGAKQAMEQIAKSFDPFQVAQMRVNTLFGNMESAIDSFVETGKFSFSDFTRSVIQDLIKIELKAQATQLLKGVLSAGGSFLGSLLGFAGGGNPPVGKPSIVGEKGPELFVPRTAGTVIPNNQLGMGGSQQTVNNNYVYNVSAIDARSVATFFAENRKTMLGTIQMAQKELPYGNR